MTRSRSYSTRAADEAGTSEPSAPVVVHRLYENARNMRREQHPWLQWPGASSQEIIKYNYKLSEIQNKVFSVPKLPIWHDLTEIRLNTVLNMMFTSRVRVNNQYVNVKPFLNALDVDEVNYREWTLEFYSTFEVEPGIESDSVNTYAKIRFRLGGRQHAMTYPQFAFACGLFTQSEVLDLLY